MVFAKKRLFHICSLRRRNRAVGFPDVPASVSGRGHQQHRNRRVPGDVMADVAQVDFPDPASALTAHDHPANLLFTDKTEDLAGWRSVAQRTCSISGASLLQFLLHLTQPQQIFFVECIQLRKQMRVNFGFVMDM